MSSSSRRKKRSKRKAKQSQKLAWMVELRMAGHNVAELTRRIKEAGNYTLARRNYEAMLKHGPSVRIYDTPSIGQIDRFNYYTSPALADIINNQGK